MVMHAVPAINYIKSYLRRHFHYLIGISLVLSGCCMSYIVLLAYVSIDFQSKHYQCQNLVLNNKTGPLFLEFNW